jgi:hypothetical protein
MFPILRLLLVVEHLVVMGLVTRGWEDQEQWASKWQMWTQKRRADGKAGH